MIGKIPKSCLFFLLSLFLSVHDAYGAGSQKYKYEVELQAGEKDEARRHQTVVYNRIDNSFETVIDNDTEKQSWWGRFFCDYKKVYAFLGFGLLIGGASYVLANIPSTSSLSPALPQPVDKPERGVDGHFIPWKSLGEMSTSSATKGDVPTSSPTGIQAFTGRTSKAPLFPAPTAPASTTGCSLEDKTTASRKTVAEESEPNVKFSETTRAAIEENTQGLATTMVVTTAAPVVDAPYFNEMDFPRFSAQEGFDGDFPQNTSPQSTPSPSVDPKAAVAIGAGAGAFGGGVVGGGIWYYLDKKGRVLKLSAVDEIRLMNPTEKGVGNVRNSGRSSVGQAAEGRISQKAQYQEIDAYQETHSGTNKKATGGKTLVADGAGSRGAYQEIDAYQETHSGTNKKAAGGKSLVADGAGSQGKNKEGFRGNVKNEKVVYAQIDKSKKNRPPAVLARTKESKQFLKVSVDSSVRVGNKQTKAWGAGAIRYEHYRNSLPSNKFEQFRFFRGEYEGKVFSRGGRGMVVSTDEARALLTRSDISLNGRQMTAVESVELRANRHWIGNVKLGKYVPPKARFARTFTIDNDPFITLSSHKTEMKNAKVLPNKKVGGTLGVCKRDVAGCHKKFHVKARLRHVEKLPGNKLIKTSPYSKILGKYKLFGKSAAPLLQMASGKFGFDSAKVTRLRNIMPAASLSLSRKLASIGRATGKFAAAYIIDAIFLGIDLSQDIPRWLTDTEIEERIMLWDDVWKYVSKAWLWGIFMPSKRVENALIEMKNIQESVENKVEQAQSSKTHFDAFHDLPFKAEKSVQEGRWEYKDNTVLYKFSYKDMQLDKRKQEGMNYSLDAFEYLLLGGENQHDVFVLTKKTGEGSEQEIARGTMASLLLSEIDADQVLLDDIQKDVATLNQIYLKFVFETVDVDKTAEKAVIQHRSLLWGSYIFRSYEDKERRIEAARSDYKAKFRDIKEKKERESKKKAQPIFAALEKKLTPVLERQARLQSYLGVFLENQPSYSADQQKLTEKLASRLQKKDESPLLNDAYSVMNTPEGTKQKHILSDLLSLSGQALVDMVAQYPTIKFMSGTDLQGHLRSDIPCASGIGSVAQKTVQPEHLVESVAVPDLLRWSRTNHTGEALHNLYDDVTATSQVPESFVAAQFEHLHKVPFVFYEVDHQNGYVQHLKSMPAASLFCYVQQNAVSSRRVRDNVVAPFTLRDQQSLLSDMINERQDENHIPVLIPENHEIARPLTGVVITDDDYSNQLSFHFETLYQQREGRLKAEYRGQEADTKKLLPVDMSLPWLQDDSSVTLYRIGGGIGDQERSVTADVLQLKSSGEGRQTYALSERFFNHLADYPDSRKAGWWDVIIYISNDFDSTGKIFSLGRFYLSGENFIKKYKAVSFYCEADKYKKLEAGQARLSVHSVDGMKSLFLEDYAEKLPELEVKASLAPGAYKVVSEHNTTKFLVTGDDWSTMREENAGQVRIPIDSALPGIRSRLAVAINGEERYGHLWKTLLDDFISDSPEGTDDPDRLSFISYKSKSVVDDEGVDSYQYQPDTVIGVNRAAALYTDNIIRLIELCGEEEQLLKINDLAFLLRNSVSLPLPTMTRFFHRYISQAVASPDTIGNVVRNTPDASPHGRTKREAGESGYQANKAATSSASLLLVGGVGATVAACMHDQGSTIAKERSIQRVGAGVWRNKKGKICPARRKICVDIHSEEAETAPTAPFNKKAIEQWLSVNRVLCPPEEIITHDDPEEATSSTPVVRDNTEPENITVVTVADALYSFAELPVSQLLPTLYEYSEVQLISFDSKTKGYRYIVQEIAPYASIVNMIMDGAVDPLERKLRHSVEDFPDRTVREWLNATQTDTETDPKLRALLDTQVRAPSEYKLMGILAELSMEMVVKNDEQGVSLYYLSAKGAPCYQQLQALFRGGLLAEGVPVSLTVSGFFSDSTIRALLNRFYANAILSPEDTGDFQSYRSVLIKEKKEEIGLPAKLSDKFDNITDILTDRDLIPYITEREKYVTCLMPSYRQFLTSFCKTAARITKKDRATFASALEKLLSDESLFIAPASPVVAARSLQVFVETGGLSGNGLFNPFVFFEGQKNNYIDSLKFVGDGLNNVLLSSSRTNEDLKGAYDYLQMEAPAPVYLKNVLLSLNSAPERIVEKVKALYEGAKRQSTQR